MNIWFGSNENAWLSNLAYRPFYIEERRFVSVEHAYQSYKSGVFDEVCYRRRWKEGVKFIGKRVDRKISIRLMSKIIEMSLLQNVDVLVKLIATGDEALTHNQDRGIWNMVFPRILMQLREKHRETVYGNQLT